MIEQPKNKQKKVKERKKMTKQKENNLNTETYVITKTFQENTKQPLCKNTNETKQTNKRIEPKQTQKKHVN